VLCCVLCCVVSRLATGTFREVSSKILARLAVYDEITTRIKNPYPVKRMRLAHVLAS